jgi:hypothetical protein
MTNELTTVVVLGAIAALVAWGVWPKAKAQKAEPTPPAPSADRDGESLKVGVVVGAMGRDIGDAAIVRYALSRQDHPATPYEIGLAAGIQRTLSDEDKA